MTTLHIEVVRDGDLFRWRRVCAAVKYTSQMAWDKFIDAFNAATGVAEAYSAVELHPVAVKNDPCYDKWRAEGAVSMTWTVLDEDPPFTFRGMVIDQEERE